MEKFAKVFESHNRQFLILKNTNDDDDLKLSIISRFDGAEIDLGLIFTGDDSETKLDEAFEIFGQEQADVFGNLLKDAKTPMEAFMALQG